MKRTILLAIGVAVFVALAAVAGTRRALPGLAFSGVDVPTSMADKSRLIVSQEARWRGRRFPIALHAFARPGDVVDGQVFGQMRDLRGQPLTDASGPRLCNSLDGASLIQAEGSWWSVSHGECQPGVLQLSRVEQDDEGILTLASTSPVDLASVGGGNLFCAGEDTPWGSHLAAEEYEVDASRLAEDGTDPGNHQDWNAMAALFGGSLRGVDPYNFGWVDEVLVLDPEGATLVTKRTAMGRFSHELAKVLPDGRTVYLSDDGNNGGFFLFVADVAGDLSVGELYAARWGAGPDGALGALVWVALGRASEAQIAPWLARKPRFEDLFERVEPVEGLCPQGFGSVNTAWKHECLKVVPGAELAASRLETRRYAALLGATTEFSKAEGLAFDPATPRLFAAISRIQRGMLEADPTWDAGGPDHIRLPPNPCGVVWGMSLGTAVDSTGQPIDSAFVAGRVDAVTAGEPKEYSGALEHNTCDLEAIAGPDNLEFVPQAGLLLIAEDTSAHDNNALWALDVANGSLQRVLTVPWAGRSPACSGTRTWAGAATSPCPCRTPSTPGAIPGGPIRWRAPTRAA